jgi:hypothetical protein
LKQNSLETNSPETNSFGRTVHRCLPTWSTP